jgi:hypothetical protein
MFSVNYIYCAIFFAILIFLGIFLPNLLRKRLYFQQKQGYNTSETLVPAIQRVRSRALTFEPMNNRAKEPDNSRNRIFYWYLKVIGFVQKLIGIAPRPQQTMREFATESGSSLGPISRYFMEVTLLTERFLYGSHEPRETDADKSRQLAEAMQSEVKDENI